MGGADDIAGPCRMPVMGGHRLPLDGWYLGPTLGMNGTHGVSHFSRVGVDGGALMLRRLFLLIVAAALVVGGCAEGDGAVSEETAATPASTTSTVDGEADAVNGRNRAYGMWGEQSLTLDVYAPVEFDDSPVVVYLPGGGQRAASTALVEALTDEGALVFVVRYAALHSDPEQVLADRGADARAMAESVACAINYARAQASEFGNNDPVVVLTGLSNGGGLAAHAALFGADLEARWDDYAAEGGPPDQVECEVTDGSTHVDALVGMAGGYDIYVPIHDGKWGRAYQQERDPELQEFLSSSIGAYADLKVRLIHGESDGVVPYSNSVDFAAALTDAGYDVGEVIPFDGGHTVPTELAIPIIMELIEP